MLKANEEGIESSVGCRGSAQQGFRTASLSERAHGMHDKDSCKKWSKSSRCFVERNAPPVIEEFQIPCRSVARQIVAQRLKVSHNRSMLK